MFENKEIDWTGLNKFMEESTDIQFTKNTDHCKRYTFYNKSLSEHDNSRYMMTLSITFSHFTVSLASGTEVYMSCKGRTLSPPDASNLDMLIFNTESQIKVEANPNKPLF